MTKKDAGKATAAQQKRIIAKLRKETGLARERANLDPAFEQALAEGRLVEDFGKWPRETSG